MPSPAEVIAERAAVVREVRAWLGTPFVWNAAVRGAGVACAPLVASAYAAVGLVPVDVLGQAHAPDDWFKHTGAELWLAGVVPYMQPTATPDVGDLLLFRLGRVVAHGGIVVELRADGPVMVHADRGTGVVAERVGPSDPWGARLAGAYTLRRWAEAEARATA